jgi:hypothetical protein
MPAAGLPPPVEAFGAVVTGYARQLAVAPAVAVVRRFHAAGGSPDAQMLDILANIAIRAGDYKVAMQVGAVAACALCTVPAVVSLGVELVFCG